MNEAVKKEWIEALRSGDYFQGRGYLRQAESVEEKYVKYCCLGVLCNIYSKQENIKWIKVGMTDSTYDNYFAIDVNKGCKDSGALPLVVAEWADLRLSNPIVNGEALINLNDNKKLTFKEIADLIEAHL